MADLFDQDPNDLEAAEYFWSVTEELVEELEHCLKAHDSAFKVGALLRPAS